MAKRLAVVAGGAGAVGKLLIERLDDRYEIAVVDRADDAPVSDITKESPELTKLLERAKLVMLAVDENVALAALDLVAKSIRGDALLVETLSVKSPFAKAFSALPHQPACVGINPLFAPSLGFEGRSVAAVRYHDSPAIDKFLKRVSRWGATVLEQTAPRHDQVAATTQALTHATTLSFGHALSEMGLTAAELRAFGPPPHQVALALLARISSGDPHVYHDIQAANPYAKKARAALQRGVTALNQSLATESLSQFAEFQSKARNVLGDELEHYRTMCATLFEHLTSARSQ